MDFLPLLLGMAVLAPLASFFTIFVLGRRLGRNGEAGAYIAVAAIVFAAICSYASLGIWLTHHFPGGGHHAAEHHDAEHHDAPAHAGASASWLSVAGAAELNLQDAAPSEPAAEKTAAEKTAAEKTAAEKTTAEKTADAAKPADAAETSAETHGAAEHAEAEHADGEHAHAAETPVIAYTGTYWLLGKFGQLEVSISYYIDSLTLVMFCMVTLIASCIHFYAMGYMHDELHEITDKEVTLSNGEYLKRQGRFHRFFQYLSLFCFSMLGLVLAGNIAMVFCFWELVGICSYFLIGFYIERKSASTAANKAFIVNRVGDFGMIIGLMALWASLGTFSFGDIDADKSGAIEPAERGLFSLVRSEANGYAVKVPDGMFVASVVKEEGEVGERARSILADHAGDAATTRSQIEAEFPDLKHPGYWLLIVAGVGIFCGCVGKSAQFPLHVWLPDAMEGPTPVSALVHSATMVAAGVYLVGRFYPVFAPEVLIVISVVGAVTLFMAATIAITAVDIKRVLAYSTVSQLGYMMLALGVGGWIAGLMHLVTHAFFKSLLFMCSGSVIHAVHTNDMREMGGLLRKMPVTAITMLIGCLAIAGVGVPFVIGFSGYYSKDAILEQAFSLSQTNGGGVPTVLFAVAAGGAAITAFYMFRMWYMTFVGQPRNQERYDHAHESPPVMYLPLVVLSVFAVSVAWDTSLLGYGLIPAGVLIWQGIQRGWFRSSGGHDAHGHDDHGHDAHGHDAHAHGHDAHGHEAHAHAHGHPAHGHAAHGHDSHHHGGAAPFTLPGVVTVLVISFIGGLLLQQVLPKSSLTLANLLSQSQPAGIQHADVIAKGELIPWTYPNEHLSHAPSIAIPVTLLATGTWIIGIGLATAMYAFGYLNPADVRRQFSPIYTLLWNKWYFDELYQIVFVKPCHVVSGWIAGIDRNWIDVFINGVAAVTRRFSEFWERLADRTVVDGIANGIASLTYRLGTSLKVLQTGRLRQYVMFIILGAVAIFILISFFWSTTLAR
ncbi:MAG: proton-conducting transporter membrane subunit [Pirellulales bacterium]